MHKGKKCLQWTRDDIKKLVTLWDIKTTDELVEELHRPKTSIAYMVKIIRGMGVIMRKKSKKGYLNMFVKATLQEMKLIK